MCRAVTAIRTNSRCQRAGDLAIGVNHLGGLCQLATIRVGHNNSQLPRHTAHPRRQANPDEAVANRPCGPPGRPLREIAEAQKLQQRQRRQDGQANDQRGHTEEPLTRRANGRHKPTDSPQSDADQPARSGLLGQRRRTKAPAAGAESRRAGSSTRTASKTSAAGATLRRQRVQDGDGEVEGRPGRSELVRHVKSTPPASCAGFGDTMLDETQHIRYGSIT